MQCEENQNALPLKFLVSRRSVVFGFDKTTLNPVVEHVKTTIYRSIDNYGYYNF